jgi:GAF domain-containing protein
MQQTSRGLLSLLTEYEDRIDQQRASGLTVIGFALFILSLGWLAMVLLSVATAPEAQMAGMAHYAVTYAAPVLSLAIWWSARRGFLGTAASLFVGLLALFALTLMGGNLSFSSVALLTLPLAAAGGLMRRPGISITAAGLVLMTVVFAIAQRQNVQPITIDPAQQVVTDLVIVLVALIIDGALLVTFAGWAPLVASDAQRDVHALQRVAAFGATLDINNEDRLLGQALSFTRNEMKFTFAQFFLIGQTGTLDERVRMAIGGKDRIERASVTSLPETGAVRESAQARRIIKVDRTDTFIRRTHFLPTTVTGALLPLVYNEHLLGILDVQHEAIPAIPDYQLLTLQTLADNVAATLSTVRQSVALKTTVRQQEETATALRARLSELTAGGRRNQRSGARLAGYNVDNDGTLVPATDMPADLRPVLESAELQVEQEGAQRVVRLPISLGDETLGVMSFTLPGNKPLTERQLETAKVVANRLALALENKRLIEQTRAQAERERLASDVANTLISATDVDSVLSVAVESFREVLGAVNSRIHVQPFQPAQPASVHNARTEPSRAALEVVPSPLPKSEPVAGD